MKALQNGEDEETASIQNEEEKCDDDNDDDDDKEENEVFCYVYEGKTITHVKRRRRCY